MNDSERTAIERRDVRRARRMNEIERIEAIDQLADRMLDQAEFADTPATTVWDMAAERVDTLARAQREAAIRAWEADRAMVSDMERDGLL